MRRAGTTGSLLVVSGLAVLTALAGLLAAPATTAHAASHAAASHAAPDGAAGGAVATDGACDPGEFCAWASRAYTGERHSWDLATAGVESCVALPEGMDARSFANRVGRLVTVFQDRECSTEGEFDTYPGGGTWVPESPYTVRAFTVWES